MLGYKKEVKTDYDSAVEKAREELKKEGFGILTEIDVKDALKKKLNVDFDRYLILGACNPPFAYKALNIEREIGLFMPCNIIIYEHDKKVYVSAIRPTLTLGAVNNPELNILAEEVELKLSKVIDAVGGKNAAV